MSHVFTGAACSSNKGFAAVIAVLNFFSAKSCCKLPLAAWVAVKLGVHFAHDVETNSKLHSASSHISLPPMLLHLQIQDLFK